MNGTAKPDMKLVRKEAAKLSKKKKKELAALGRAGKGSIKPPMTIESKRREKTRPNVHKDYLSGKYD